MFEKLEDGEINELIQLIYDKIDRLEGEMKYVTSQNKPYLKQKILKLKNIRNKLLKRG